MIDILAAADFREHATQLKRAYVRGEDMEDGWIVAVAGGRVVGVACAQLALDYSDLITALGFEPPHIHFGDRSRCRVPGAGSGSATASRGC